MKIIKLLFGSCDQHIFYFLFTTNQTSSIKKNFFFISFTLGEWVILFQVLIMYLFLKKFIQCFHFCLKYINERVEEKQCGPSCKSS